MAINKNQKGNKKAVYLAIAFVVFLLAMLLVMLFLNKSTNYQSKNPEIPSVTPQNKTYSSKAMKISVDVPINFQTEERFTTIIFKKNEDYVTLSRNGTNLSTLNEYLKDFDIKRNIAIEGDKRIIINGYDSVVRTMNFPQQNFEQKSYYIYVSNWVYIISTKFKSLYPDLDQIAQSFRYSP